MTTQRSIYRVCQGRPLQMCEEEYKGIIYGDLMITEYSINPLHAEIVICDGFENNIGILHVLKKKRGVVNDKDEIF